MFEEMGFKVQFEADGSIYFRRDDFGCSMVVRPDKTV
jgi:hypothetical protein